MYTYIIDVRNEKIADEHEMWTVRGSSRSTKSLELMTLNRQRKENDVFPFN